MPSTDLRRSLKQKYSTRLCSHEAANSAFLQASLETHGQRWHIPVQGLVPEYGYWVYIPVQLPRFTLIYPHQYAVGIIIYTPYTGIITPIYPNIPPPMDRLKTHRARGPTNGTTQRRRQCVPLGSEYVPRRLMLWKTPLSSMHSAPSRNALCRGTTASPTVQPSPHTCTLTLGMLQQQKVVVKTSTLYLKK